MEGLTSKQIMEMYKISRSTFQQWVKKGTCTIIGTTRGDNNRPMNLYLLNVDLMGTPLRKTRTETQKRIHSKLKKVYWSEDGRSAREIANSAEVSISTVYYWITRGYLQFLPHGGIKPTNMDDLILEEQVYEASLTRNQEEEKEYEDDEEYDEDNDFVEPDPELDVQRWLEYHKWEEISVSEKNEILEDMQLWQSIEEDEFCQILIERIFGFWVSENSYFERSEIEQKVLIAGIPDGKYKKDLFEYLKLQKKRRK